MKGTDRLWDTWMQLPDGIIIVESKPPADKRSLRMNDYWWAVPVEQIRVHINHSYGKNYSPKQVSDMLKEQFGITEYEIKLKRNDQGKMQEIEVAVLKSTADYTVREFQDLWNGVAQFAAERWKIEIAEPHPEWRLGNKERCEKVTSAMTDNIPVPH